MLTNTSKKEILEYSNSYIASNFKNLNPELQDDEDIAKIAIEENSNNLEFVSERLRDNEELVKMAVLDDEFNLRYAGDSIIDDEEIVKIALSKCGLTLEFASERLRDDEGFVRMAVMNYGIALEYASPRIKKNREIVMLAIQDMPESVKYIDEDLRRDVEFMENIVKMCGEAVEYLLVEEDENISVERILEAAKEYEIENIVHFTNAENLESILRNGICTRDNMDERNIKYRYTDGERWDGIDGISLSISFPNYYMFRTKRYDIRDTDWCVILLDPEKVLKKKNLYFSHNAACKHFNDNKFDKHRFVDFNSMFADKVYVKHTYERNFKNGEKCYTTSPQAEVMCLETIEKECIKAFVFSTEEIKQKYESVVKLWGNNVEIIVDDNYFTSGPYAEN